MNWKLLGCVSLYCAVAVVAAFFAVGWAMDPDLGINVLLFAAALLAAILFGKFMVER